MNEGTVSSISFEEDGSITLAWYIPEESDEQGGNFYQSYLSKEGLMASEEVAYWSNELKQAADELLGEWRRHRRKPSDKARN